MASKKANRPDGMALIDGALEGKVVATPPDKPVGLDEQALAYRMLAYDKQKFLDSVAVELFGKGWPHADIYRRAEVLWEIREHYLAGKPYTKQLGDKQRPR